jgi:hypothetical protein
MMRIVTVLIAAAAMFATPALAANDPATVYTRTAEAGAQRPVASVAELAWLIGRWEGPGIAGASSQEAWSAPLGGVMAGTFVQADSKGGVMFSEVMQIAPDGDSLIVRLKHFNADLTGWEEKDKSVNFRLIAREGNSWYFNGLTYRRVGRDRLLVAVRMRGDDGKASELVFRFRRVGS